MKLLVHLHLYYHDQLDWYLEKISHIQGCEWDLIVTVSEPNPATEEKIKAFRADARILQVANVGYDIWPFICVLREVDMDGYDAILKLHTKNANQEANRINGMRVKGYRWRDLLVNPLLESPEQFSRALAILEQDPKCGMVCSGFMIRRLTEGLPEDQQLLQEEMQRVGLKTQNKRFCAGTMFLARTAPFRWLRDSDLKADFFGTGARSHSLGSPAHVYERILSMLMAENGYSIRPVKWRPLRYTLWKLMRGVEPLGQFVFEISRKGPDRRKYLTLFGFRIPLEKK